jgi:hypothetical protein
LYKKVIKYFILHFIFAPILGGFAQDDEIVKQQPESIFTAPKSSSMDLQAISKISLTKDIDSKNYAVTRNILMEHPVIVTPAKKTKNVSGFYEVSSNLVSSFRNNIRFGGFWEKWAIINFSPSVFIKPFDFLNIYANQQISYFIPVTEIKDRMKELCIQGAAIIAVDNAFKFFINSDELIPVLTNFAVKNIVLALVNKSVGRKKTKDVYQYNSYYYSMSIRF